MTFLGAATGLICGIFFHELAHFVFARFLGIEVLKVQFGGNPFLLKWRTTIAQWEIGANPLKGAVFWIPPRDKSQIPIFLCIAAGPICNAAIALIGYVSLEKFGLSSSPRMFLIGFTLIQVWLVFLNLVPWNRGRGANLIASDGYKLLEIATTSITRKRSNSFIMIDKILKPYLGKDQEIRVERDLGDFEWRTLFNAIVFWNEQSTTQIIRSVDVLRENLSHPSVIELFLLDVAATKHVLSSKIPDEKYFVDMSKLLLERIDNFAVRTATVEHTRQALLVETGQHHIALQMPDYAVSDTANTFADCLNNAYRARCEHVVGNTEVAREKAKAAEALSAKVPSSRNVVHVLERMRVEMSI